MKNFCLITNIYKDRDLILSKKLQHYIISNGGNCQQLVSAYQEDDPRNFSPDDIREDTEIIMVLGGDGTLIRTATKVEDKKIPLLGVNLGTLGYLCELDQLSVFSAIDHLFKDEYTLEDRIMLAGNKIGEEAQCLAMNDVVIHHGGDIKLLRLKVFVNGEFLYTYDADGIIISTPTGSTGYSMSAGGPIVDPKGDMILMTPNNSHNLSSKSIVLCGDDEIEIEVSPERSYERANIYVSNDGDRYCQMFPGERFRVRRSNNRIRICKISKRSFLEILRKKMVSYN